MTWTARLEADGLPTLEFDPTAGWFIDLDLGDAPPRDTSIDAPDRSGRIDRTRLEGGRTIALSVMATPDVTDVETMERRLKAFTHPELRPVLYFRRADGIERRAIVRKHRFSGTIQQQLGSFLVQWEVPSGLLESAELHSATAAASGDTVDGRSYDLEFDREYPPSEPQASVLVVNQGDRDAWPLLRLYGPWSGATRIENMTHGKGLSFSGLSVSAGDFLEVDTRARTIRLNGDPGDSRHIRLVPSSSQWWSIRPGEQRIRFITSSPTTPAHAEIVWRDAFS